FITVFYFSFHLRVLHPYLHSFPTRRSSDLTRVNVSCLDESVVVIGYYALNNHSIDASALPEPDRKKLPSYESIPAIYLSKVGVQIGRHTSELQSRGHLVCRLVLEKKKQEAE